MTDKANNTLTDRQSETLKVIHRFIKENRYSPSVRDLCKLLGINSPNGIESHLRILEEKGYISRQKKIARSIVPLLLDKE